MAQGKKGAIEQDKFIKIRINSKLYKDSQELAKQRGTNFSKMVRDYLQAVLADQGKDPIENNIKNFLKKIVK